MESQPQNPEFRNNLEAFAHVIHSECAILMISLFCLLRAGKILTVSNVSY